MKRQLFLNEICDSLDKEKDHLMHLKRLYTMKPTFKINPPKKPKFLAHNFSRDLKRAQTQYNIDYENGILRDRLSYINSKKGPYNQNDLRPKTGIPKRTFINYSFQDLENMKKTLQDNIKIYTKVNNMRSYYEFKDINKNAKLQIKYRDNLLKKNRYIKKLPSLDYINFEQFKNIMENQNENEENINQESNGIIEEDIKEEEKENEEKLKNDEINENTVNIIKEDKKYNVTTTNNSTKEKNMVH